jgi:hypothetical protein
VTDGPALFQNLSLSQTGSGYVFKVAMTGLSSMDTNSVTVAAPKPGVGYYYPLPVNGSLENAVVAADSNNNATNFITLAVSTIPYPVTEGQLLVENESSLKSKTLTIAGQGESSSIITAAGTSRILESVGTDLVLWDLTVTGGRATDGGILGGNAALGGGLLIDGGNVNLSIVAVLNNAASGASGAAGAVGKSATAGRAQAPRGAASTSPEAACRR